MLTKASLHAHAKRFCMRSENLILSITQWDVLAEVTAGICSSLNISDGTVRTKRPRKEIRK